MIGMFYPFIIFWQKHTTNSDPKASPISTMEDRISVLPDALIHHIFSFMHMSDVVNTSVLSNRWKHLWLATPTLKFEYDSPDCENINCLDGLSRCDMCKEARTRHVDFVDRVLITRQCNLVKFQISDCLDVDANHILTWLIGVLGLQAQEIILFFETDVSLQLPHNLFNPNIRVLELSFPLVGLIRLPNSIPRATRLTSLDLNNVCFPDGNADGELTLSFPVLKNLKMHDCDLSNLTDLTVSTPLIERLEFYSLYTMDNVSCKVKTSAPNLRSLEVTISAPVDWCSVDFCVEDLVSLVSASISVGFRTGNGYLAKNCSQHLSEVLTGIYNVQTLRVSDLLTRVITAVPESLERLPKLFQNLRSLMLKDEYQYDVPKRVQKVQEAVIFLERLPHIETLVWERTYMDRWLYEDEDWLASVPPQGIFSCLKRFEYRNFLGSDIEQKFLEFLLERARVLKELTIKTPSVSSLSGKLTPFKEKLLSLSQYSDKLSSLPHASSGVTISYQPRS